MPFALVPSAAHRADTLAAPASEEHADPATFGLEIHEPSVAGA